MNIFSLHVEGLSIGFLTIALSASVILAAVLAGALAWKRLVKSHITVAMLVVMLNLGAALSVLGLIFDVSYFSSKAIHIYLLTSNANVNDLDEVDSSEAEIIWLRLNDQIADSSASDKTVFSGQKQLPEAISSINSISQLPLHYPLISRLVLLGDGLSPSQWQELTSAYARQGKNTSPEVPNDAIHALPFIVQSGYTPQLGLIDMQWPKHLKVGEFAQISGRLQAPKSKVSNERQPAQNSLYTLTLLDPFGEKIASQRLRDNENFLFELQATVTGRWLYTLALKGASQTEIKIKEVINIEVLDTAAIKVMVKQSAPSFETRQLQNLLNEQGSKVLSLTQISKNKEIAQFTNLDEREKALAENPFSAQALAYFDILIIDQRATSLLTQAQVGAVDTAIKEGLGVLILIDAQQAEGWGNLQAPWLNKISVTPKPMSPSSQQSTFLRWQFQNIETPINAIAARLQANSSAHSIILVSEQNGEALAIAINYGLGQVSGSLFTSSYAFKTQGKPELHSHYWQWMIQNIARNDSTMRWEQNVVSTPLLVGHQQANCLVNTSSKPVIHYQQAMDEVVLNARSQLLDKQKMCVTYWPIAPGWFSIVAEVPETPLVSMAAYAYSSGDWQTWRQNIKRTATSNMVAQQNDYVANIVEREIEVNKFWFWTFLISCLTALWIEQRLSRR